MWLYCHNLVQNETEFLFKTNFIGNAMPKVSVIIPVYNTEEYLDKCLDSVCNQTLSDIEIICINDCSTDNSLGILKNYAQKDPRIVVINFTENKGVSVARNNGIDTATGEYIGFVDSDDFIDLDFYEKLYNKAIETKADAVKGNLYNVEINGRTILTGFYDKNEEIRKNKTNFLYGFTSAIYRTDLIKKHAINFPVGITHFEDPYFSINVTLKFNNIETVDDAKYYYQRHVDSACYACKNYEKTCDFVKSVDLIISKINNADVKKEDYFIYFDFLINHILDWCSDSKLSNEANFIAVSGLTNLINNTKYDIKDCLYFYFIKKKQLKIEADKLVRAKIAAQLRHKIQEK